jgi:hypothetical protein
MKGREKRGKKRTKKMGEMVGDQTANQAAKLLRKGEKEREKNHPFWKSKIVGLVVFTSLVSSSSIFVS